MSSREAAAFHSFVQRLTARSVLSDEEVAAVLDLKRQTKEIPAHVDIVAFGEKVGHSCLVVDGLAGRFGQNREGGRQISCLHIAGDVADLVSVVSPRTGWGLVALARTTIVRIAHADLRRLMVSHPAIAEAFWRDSVADGSIFSEWVVNVGRRDALTRIAHIFCEMAIRSEIAGRGDRRSYPLPITQSGLGDATGLTPVHVNRILRELRERSLVDLRAGTVTIHDWDGLVSAGDFDPIYLMLDSPPPKLFEPG